MTVAQVLKALKNARPTDQVYVRNKTSPDFFEQVIAVVQTSCYMDFQHKVPTRMAPLPPVNKKQRIKIIELRVAE